MALESLQLLLVDKLTRVVHGMLALIHREWISFNGRTWLAEDLGSSLHLRSWLRVHVGANALLTDLFASFRMAYLVAY